MKAYRIGIDVGGTKIAYGLFDEDNNLIDRLREATDPSIDGPSLADQILRQIRTVLQRNALEEKDLKGIGVCMPSFILFDEGYICMTSAMTNVRDFPMRSYMAERLSVPIVLDNDSVKARLQNYVFIELFVDDKQDRDGDGMSEGDENSQHQREKFSSNAQPFYVQLDPYGHQVATPMAFTTDPEEFINWLQY